MFLPTIQEPPNFLFQVAHQICSYFLLRTPQYALPTVPPICCSLFGRPPFCSSWVPSNYSTCLLGGPQFTLPVYSVPPVSSSCIWSTPISFSLGPPNLLSVSIRRPSNLLFQGSPQFSLPRGSQFVPPFYSGVPNLLLLSIWAPNSLLSIRRPPSLLFLGTQQIAPTDYSGPRVCSSWAPRFCSFCLFGDPINCSSCGPPVCSTIYHSRPPVCLFSLFFPPPPFALSVYWGPAVCSSCLFKDALICYCRLFGGPPICFSSNESTYIF